MDPFLGLLVLAVFTLRSLSCVDKKNNLFNLPNTRINDGGPWVKLQNISFHYNCKGALMADQASLPSPTDKYRRPTSSFFSGLTKISLSETEASMSPTSILDSKPFSGFRNPFGSEPKTPEPHEHKRLWDNSASIGILALVPDDQSKPKSRMVLFGSQLKIQIPTLLVSPAESPKSPADFGVKTETFQKSPFGSENSGLETPKSPCFFTGCISVSEMELSEEYTCVITHGPNPRTTHIFDNCIIESSCGVNKESFLSSCLNCNKHLGQGDDIFIYRGEKAFCSVECRCQEIEHGQ